MRRADPANLDATLRAGRPLSSRILRRQRPGRLSPRVRGNQDHVVVRGRRPRSIPASAGEPPARRGRAPDARVYPRECGGTRAITGDGSFDPGLSPRVRGNRDVGADRRAGDGSIPASAGEPDGWLCEGCHDGVYPRECGGTRDDQARTDPHPGLSPRVRGNRVLRLVPASERGSIPASAGEPWAWGATKTAFTVYPRECGGTAQDLGNMDAAEGLSPRVRGNPLHGGQQGFVVGSIPASAGEPRPRGANHRPAPVYPRECGGTPPALLGETADRGLSPRVRGNRSGRSPGGRRAWSIPASAGEPSGRWPHRACRGVYPRECGGTCQPSTSQHQPAGLSPRVRGNRHQRCHFQSASGSIPASAGEPVLRFASGEQATVYPRECGGTIPQLPSSPPPRGLSPRVRGNRCTAAPRPAAAGSIPASAGEPATSWRCRGSGRVYPRECGGTSLTRSRFTRLPGLSPRVRGNLVEAHNQPQDAGSIPASAGEPGRAPPARWRFRVYPRECGGTWHRVLDQAPGVGLSPRVRGNLGRQPRQAVDRGSIPASAGEPPRRHRIGCATRVYPRECGGTPWVTASACAGEGLSPRVRGNQVPIVVRLRRVGSIPASAGEPPPCAPRQDVHQVYPRECGGTENAAARRLPGAGLSPRVRGNRIRK